MKRSVNCGLLVLLLALAGCSNTASSGSRSAAASSTSSTTATTAPTTSSTGPTTTAPPHFDTPEAAMTYLAAAWNTNNTAELDHVTNPAARAQLDQMHNEAVNLRLDHCTLRPGVGDYICSFNHDYPSGTSTTMAGGVGQAVFLVGPADTPGWYMTVFQSCG